MRKWLLHPLRSFEVPVGTSSIVALVGLVILLSRCAHIAPPLGNPSQIPIPTRAVVLLFDGLSTDDIARYHMARFQSLAARGASFPKAYVGDFPAAPIVSYPVLLTGKKPAGLPWQDKLFVDVSGVLGPKGTFYNLETLGEKSLRKLLDTPSMSTALPLSIRASLKGTGFALAPTPGLVLALGGVSIDIARFGPSPLGQSETSGSFAPADDAWTASAVNEIFTQRPGWRLITASFGGIWTAKAGLKPLAGPTKRNGRAIASQGAASGDDLAFAMAAADGALGQVLDTLESSGALKDTILVVTAGAGAGAAEARDMVYGVGANFTQTKVPPPLSGLFRDGRVAAAVLGRTPRLWLKDHSLENIAKVAREAKSIPGVGEVYRKQNAGKSIQYIRETRNHEMKPPALVWNKEHLQDLLSASASSASADVILFSIDGQEGAQRIPLFVLSPNLKAPGVQSTQEVRLSDVNPMVLKAMKLSIPGGVDGSSAAIEPLLISEE